MVFKLFIYQPLSYLGLNLVEIQVVLLFCIKTPLNYLLNPTKIENYAIWVKLDKKLLNLDKHVYIGGVYIPPSDSQYALKTPFEELEQDFLELSDGHIL